MWRDVVRSPRYNSERQELYIDARFRAVESLRGQDRSPMKCSVGGSALGRDRTAFAFTRASSSEAVVPIREGFACSASGVGEKRR